MDIRIENENELYNSFDKYEETLSENLISYITCKESITPIKERETIKIYSKENLNEDKFKNAFNKYCDDQLILIKRKQKINSTKQIWLLFIGMLFIVFSITLTNKINIIILEIISTIGSFSIWESANSWLLQSKAIKFDKLRILKLKKSEIKFLNT